MSKTRQDTAFDPTGHPHAQITTLKHDYPDGYYFPAHFHDRDQLIYASRGVMTVGTNQGTWVLPPQRAAWIPARTPHDVHISGLVSLRTLYFKPYLVHALPRCCCVVNVSSFLKELILAACDFATLDKRVEEQAHLIGVILDQMRRVQSVPLQLSPPSDPRAKQVAEVLTSYPSDERKLEQICKSAGASKRTIERLFHRDTGLSLGKWRRGVRLMHAMQLLAGGEKIAYAAFDAGYCTPSAFISSFKKALGITPGKYFSSRNESVRYRRRKSLLSG